MILTFTVIVDEEMTLFGFASFSQKISPALIQLNR
jgi:hypothetical protein